MTQRPLVLHSRLVQDASRCGIVREVLGEDSMNPESESVGDDSSKRLGGIPFTPIWKPDPVTNFGASMNWLVSPSDRSHEHILFLPDNREVNSQSLLPSPCVSANPPRRLTFGVWVGNSRSGCGDIAVTCELLNPRRIA